MKNKVVHLPITKEVVHDSPGFAKKLLADTDALDAVGAHVELMALCGAGCVYCSSNAGNFLRINRGAFALETERQLGERVAPVDIFNNMGELTHKADPALTFVWDGVVEKLEAQIARKGPKWGAGKMMVMSQFTDVWSPRQAADGTTLRVLRLLLEKTQWMVRGLTKFAGVAKPPFLPLLREHRDRVLVGLSIGSLDDEWASRIEIGTSPPSARVRAMRALQDAGVRTYGMLCPVFPDVVFDKAPGRRLEDLLNAINAKACAHVFFEALNDRDNWRAVALGYPDGSEGRRWIERVWGEGDRAAWSRYATELHVRMLTKARDEGWEARHLLYEEMITAADARAFAGFGAAGARVPALEGVLLQSPVTKADFKDDARAGAGWSRNPHIRALQLTPDHGHADGWKKARIAAGLKVCGAPAQQSLRGT